MGRQPWRVKTLATFKKTEKFSKYIKDNEKQFLTVGGEK